MTRRWRAWLAQARWALPVMVAVAALLGLPTPVLARGGGGGHGGGGGGHSSGGGFSGGGGGGGFGGGGFSGGGGGYYGGSGSGLIGDLFFAVIVVLVLAVVIYRATHHRRALQEHVASVPDVPQGPAGSLLPGGAGAVTLPDPAVIAAVSQIKRADPDFEPETFLQRAEMAFLLVKRAYQDRNAHEGRAFLSPQLWQSWSQEVEQLTAAHQRPVLENLNVRGMQVPFVAHGEGGDTIQVHFDYVAAPHTVDDRDGRSVQGTAQDQRFGEQWVFERLAGARTVAGGGVTASKCPNCGGPLKLNDDGVCDWCKADITSGRYDWVTSRIDQDWFLGASTPAAFGAAEMAPDVGLATIRQADPAFDPKAFVGRAQQAFFALQQAWQDRDLTASKPFMSPGLYLGWSSQVQQLIELHKKNVLEGLRVDGIEAVKVVHGQAFDDVTVRVRASCADYEVDERTGKLIFGSRSPAQFVEYWTFQRSVDAQTTGRSILDKVCPNCGAPLEINQIGECRYCKAAVTSGRFDWVLSRIEQEDEYAG